MLAFRSSRAVLALSMLLAVFVVVLASGAVYAATPSETKLTAFDGASGDLFGFSVSISGDTAIVGARSDRVDGLSSGSAYVFERSGGIWMQKAKLTAFDGASGDNFGGSVSISGDTAIVGAIFDDDKAILSGSAYMFERDQGGADNWGQVAKLTASDGALSDLFGVSVSISGDTAIVGAYADDLGTGISSGSAYVFERNEGGIGKWGEVKKLTASDGAAFDQFGFSVSISGDTAIVGAYSDDLGTSVNSGSAYVFKRNEGGAGTWGEVKKLTASDGVVPDQFGLSVSISGDTAIVGAHRDDDDGRDSGSAYVYEFNQPPIADANGPYVAECASPSGASVSLDGSGSTDPDGDTLTFSWSDTGIIFDDATSPTPTATFPIGTTTVTLEVDDGTAMDSDTTDVTVQDTTVPDVAAALVPIGDGDEDDDDEGRFRVEFSATDACDASPAVSAVLEVSGIADPIAVTNGQVIEFEFEDDGTEVETENGVLEIESPGLTLRVTGTDSSGNTGEATAQPTGLNADNDSEYDDDD